jgi:hypothetical protein
MLVELHWTETDSMPIGRRLATLSCEPICTTAGATVPAHQTLRHLRVYVSILHASCLEFVGEGLSDTDVDRVSGVMAEPQEGVSDALIGFATESSRLGNANPTQYFSRDMNKGCIFQSPSAFFSA